MVHEFIAFHLSRVAYIDVLRRHCKLSLRNITYQFLAICLAQTRIEDSICSSSGPPQKNSGLPIPITYSGFVKVGRSHFKKVILLQRYRIRNKLSYGK
jgi:hypothetical protein